jgi:hypothetical protein
VSKQLGISRVVLSSMELVIVIGLIVGCFVDVVAVAKLTGIKMYGFVS